MAASLTADTLRRNYGSTIPMMPIKAQKNNVFYIGQIVGITTGGIAIPGGATGWDQTVIVYGVCAFQLDTTPDASDGLHDVIVTPGTFGDFLTGTSSDLIDVTKIGQACYAKDDNTVYLTSDSTTLPKAGTIFDIADDGTSVVVQFEVIR